MKIAYSAIALGAVLMALGPATAVSQDRIPELRRQAPKDTTLTGCVARGAAGTYVLTNVIKEGEATAKDATARVSVVLSSPDDVDISRHVDQRVSVTGLYAGEGLTLRAPGTVEKPTAAEPASPSDEKPARTFRVKSLAMLGTCAQATGYLVRF